MIRRWRFGLAAVAAALVVAACGSSSPGNSTSTGAGTRQVTASTGTPITGGTAYWAEQPLQPPNYIFPLISGEYYSNANVYEFQTLMYRQLYLYGDRGKPSVDYPLSLGDAPVYSDGDRVVTIRLKPAKWSNGDPVSARDVIFWINLLKANRADWASYVPGGFPDNVVSATATGARSVRLRLNRSYNPVWFTNNELSQITPLPMAWDRTRLDPFHATPKPTDPHLPDTTAAGARQVYMFLNEQAKDPSSYASSPIWSVVDGPWKLSQLTANGEATFVPNPHYDGPNRPKLARFVELPFTSEEAEFSVLKAGSSKGDIGGSAPQISVGYIPDTDVPQGSSLKSQGYRLSAFYPYGFDYFEPNFSNRPSARSCGSCTSVRRSSISSTRRAGFTPTTRGSAFRPTAPSRPNPRIHTPTASRNRIRIRSASRGPRASSSLTDGRSVPTASPPVPTRAPAAANAASAFRLASRCGSA